MLQKAVQNYYAFFDEKLGSGTFFVLMVTAIICFVGIMVPSANAQNEHMKASAFEIKNNVSQKNIIVIDGISYEVEFQRVK